ncbi:MAG: helix-turn-helix domain-containing protein [Clostridia bacterium]|nr:helix-turn-helix domain-containing protein [Clostridia bacterium]
MKLAEKLILLRKKNGWSQEELAEKAGVALQTVSEWESGQSAPDIEQIVKLGELFGVSTDSLLKDEVQSENSSASAPKKDVKRVSFEEATEYIEQRKRASRIISIATFLCILSPIALLILAAAANTGVIALAENVACIIGIVALFIFVTIAVAMFVYCGFTNAPYEYIERSAEYELEQGVGEKVAEMQKAFRNRYVLCNIIAICFCVLSPVPVTVAAFLGNQFLTVVFLCVTIIFAGIGVFLFVSNGVRWASMQKLLIKGENAGNAASRSAITENVRSCYWGVIVAIYLLWSFLSGQWNISWLVFVVCGVLYPVVMSICDYISNKRNGK